MRKGFKKRYIRKSKYDKYKKLIFVCLFACSLLSVLGYSLYRETITRTLALSINRPTFTITLNEESATTSGTTTIYVKYGTGYYLDSNLSNQMTTSSNGIIVPKKTGYVFLGYYTATSGGGTQYIDKNGKLTSNASTTNFSSNGTLYAYWMEVKAENLSYDNTNTGVSCSEAQCMIDYLAGLLS